MWFLPVFLGLALLLAACSSDARSAVIAEHPEHSATSAGSDSLPAAGQEQDTRVPAPFLLAGTLLLEDSDQAIDPEAASELLPLWQAYRSLVNSDTASQVEVDALLDQIQDTMGEERMVAIAEMDLQSQNMGELLQGLGLESRQGQGEAREHRHRPGRAWL
jgi:hypothetical protein